ncbi:MAG: hypothetical protein AVDCRST_MAG73-358, partial [uncultured Thermomicrobiales bacterium]
DGPLRSTRAARALDGGNPDRSHRRRRRAVVGGRLEVYRPARRRPGQRRGRLGPARRLRRLLRRGRHRPVRRSAADDAQRRWSGHLPPPIDGRGRYHPRVRLEGRAGGRPLSRVAAGGSSPEPGRRRGGGHRRSGGAGGRIGGAGRRAVAGRDRPRGRPGGRLRGAGGVRRQHPAHPLGGSRRRQGRLRPDHRPGDPAQAERRRRRVPLRPASRPDRDHGSPGDLAAAGRDPHRRRARRVVSGRERRCTRPGVRGRGGRTDRGGRCLHRRSRFPPDRHRLGAARRGRSTLRVRRRRPGDDQTGRAGRAADEGGVGCVFGDDAPSARPGGAGL